MRLCRLDLTRYGKFTDQAIDFGPAGAGAPDLHIIYGLNEAGKSTTFAAYLDLLFGIPERSPYNFLHPYNTMQIGAQLAFGGSEHALVRLKQRSGSLVDADGQPVNEAMLASALGGIGRDAYRTMFSLDDQSLKDGGHAIMQSRGELGELLFSASTGLAGLSRSLVAASEEAAAIYRKRASGTELAELKRTLAALKAERDAIDTFAAAYQALTASHVQAETAYETAMAELGEAKARHAELARILGVLPLAGELARLEQALSTQGDLPRPPSEWFQLLPQLARDETRLQAVLASFDRQIDTLTAEIDGMAVDEDVLALSPRIAALDDRRARTAEDDLPKRRLTLAEHDAMIAGILAELEQAGHAAPETLLLPASLTGVIRDLIESRSGVDAELAGATRELTRAEDSLRRLREQGGTAAADADSASPEALARIEKALARLSGSDLQSRLAIEQRAEAQARRDFNGKLALLAPWSDDMDALGALPAVDLRQIEAWRTQSADIDRRITEHQRRLRDLLTEQRQMQARIASFEDRGSIDDGQARSLRRERDKAWEEHLCRLDIDSAKVFEAKLQRDDALSAERLARAQELAELRQLTQSMTVQAAARERDEELLAEAQAESTLLAGKLRALLPAGFAADGGPAELLPVLDRWCDRRAKALAAWDVLRDAKSRVAAIREELGQHAGALASALEHAGLADADGSSAIDLAEAASDLLAQAKGRQAERTAHEKSLATLERDVAERARDRQEAQAAAEGWQAAWQEALAKTWFADRADSVPSVREILKVLGALPGMLREREQMAQRIATMERDQAQFRDELSAVLDALGIALESDDTLAAAATLRHRHDTALRAGQVRANRQADLEKLGDDRRTLGEELAVHNARKAELTAFFGADTLAAVSLHLEQVQERERLDARMRDLRQQVADALRVRGFDEAETLLGDIDAADTERQAAELAARIDDLTERTRQLFAEKSRAKDKLDAVGGDDAVARIEAQRRTIFLEIEDRALRYLRLRAGIAAAEEALHLYREKHRSSMMNRASEAFRLITGGNYAGLTTRPDKDREILIGIARDGGSKLAESMSTGTQFQLYLALRLAGYEEFATVRPSVPFIADDIMESFDNPRSEEVFRLLGEMAKVGQVIYLTHHWHLCEIARAVVPGVRIHEIR